jgi:predicted 2-oxoglutarate/Fe(II)-dependent dioxygenase YbiX
MARPHVQTTVSIGDPMPRITLPLVPGGLFDSWDQITSGCARVYWLGMPPSVSVAARLAEILAGCETLLHIVTAAPPQVVEASPSWLVDPAGELGRAFGATGPVAVVVDASGRVAAVLSPPTPDAVEALVASLYAASTPTVVQAKAPVLLVDRVVEPAMCARLIDYWQAGKKFLNEVGSESGNVVNPDLKRRQDVQLDDPALFTELRDCLVRRVVPAMVQAFHARINVIEAPLIGCYEAGGGWFRRHRDNTSRHNTHRQFALSLNLNPDHEYDGGEVRFPEYGRELYRPVMGGALVFSCSLVHEVPPVTRGRRFGVFTFLSASGPASGMGPTPRR